MSCVSEDDRRDDTYDVYQVVTRIRLDSRIVLGRLDPVDDQSLYLLYGLSCIARANRASGRKSRCRYKKILVCEKEMGRSI